MRIAPCTVADIEAAPNIGALLAEYGAEAGIPELGSPAAQFETYKMLEKAGALRCIGAFRDDDLIGVATVLRSTLPHFGRQVGIVESLFVTAEARVGGAGLGLLHAAEEMTRSQGGEALLVSAPAGGRLESILPRTGYRATNTIFFRSLL